MSNTDNGTQAEANKGPDASGATDQATETPQGDAAGTETPKGDGEAKFTQADVDRIVSERLSRQQRTAEAAANKTAEERIKALEDELASSKHAALIKSVQATYGISDADADLFLTGDDADTLNAQGKALAERTPDRKPKTNVVPREGSAPEVNQADADRVAFVRRLTGRQ